MAHGHALRLRGAQPSTQDRLEGLPKRVKHGRCPRPYWRSAQHEGGLVGLLERVERGQFRRSSQHKGRLEGLLECVERHVPCACSGAQPSTKVVWKACWSASNAA